MRPGELEAGSAETAGAPLLSIIVPAVNAGEVLGGALASLAAQTFRAFEVIVCDGSSSDGTVAVANGFVDSVPGLHIDSRPDSGVYDAINRGVGLAQGLWFLVLGSDDRLHASTTLAEATAALSTLDDTVQLAYGDVRMMAANGCGVEPGGRFAGPMPLRRLFKANLCQQAIFYRRSLFVRLGGFDLRYRLYADWDFNIRAGFITGQRWLDLIVADYAATGMSARCSDLLFLAERPEVIRREFMTRPGIRALWPLQKQLLSDANRQLRAGSRRLALRLCASYLQLLALRLPSLLRPR